MRRKRLRARHGRQQLAFWSDRILEDAVLWATVGFLTFALGSSHPVHRLAAPGPTAALEGLILQDDQQAAAPAEDPGAWKYFRPAWDARAYEDWTAAAPCCDFERAELLKQIVSDPRKALSSEFSVSRDFDPRVLFWLKVHAQYSSHFRIFHDRNHPEIIYGVADFSSVFAQAQSEAAALTQAWRYEQQILKALKSKLSAAFALSESPAIAPLERAKIREFFSHHGALSATRSAELIRSIRTQTGQRDVFAKALVRSARLLPYIESTMLSYGLPKELGRIPFVESSFNPNAYSKVGAVGMWQFMPVTARQMIHSTREDLWRDPLRQTRAAARMMLIFRSLLPDWSTSVTAYNSGVGRLQRLVRRHRAESIVPLLETADGDGLGFAGKNFYAQFISANLVESYKDILFPHREITDRDMQLVFQRPTPFTQRF